MDILGATGVPGTLGLVRTPEGGVDGYGMSGVPAFGVPVPCSVRKRRRPQLRVDSHERASPMDILGAIGVPGTLGLVRTPEGGVDGYGISGELDDSAIMSHYIERMLCA